MHATPHAINGFGDFWPTTCKLRLGKALFQILVKEV